MYIEFLSSAIDYFISVAPGSSELSDVVNQVAFNRSHDMLAACKGAASLLAGSLKHHTAPRGIRPCQNKRCNTSKGIR